jgi:hypothetical protein
MVEVEIVLEAGVVEPKIHNGVQFFRHDRLPRIDEETWRRQRDQRRHLCDLRGRSDDVAHRDVDLEPNPGAIEVRLEDDAGALVFLARTDL